jgi:hypothetical protein
LVHSSRYQSQTSPTSQKETNPKLYKDYFNKTKAHAQLKIYTDVAIIDEKAGAVILCGDTEIQIKSSDKCSIYTAEVLPILEAIKYFIQFVDDERCFILSDSLSAITSIQNTVNPSDIARNIQNSCNTA